jgi:soluble lytic murein transglycosylase-like protein
MLLGPCLLLLAGSAFGHYLLKRQGALEHQLRDVREQMEGRLQKLDAGIAFDSKRRQLLLGVRDEILAANKRLGPERAYEYSTYLLTACDKYPTVDPLLLLAIGIAESGYDPLAQSSARARGLYQVWPSTGRMLAGMLGWQYTDAMLHDPGKNTALAALYLHLLFTAYNDESLVLAEYNGGPVNAGYLRAGDKRAAAETRHYVAKVLQLHERLRTKLDQSSPSVGEETGPVPKVAHLKAGSGAEPAAAP